MAIALPGEGQPKRKLTSPTDVQQGMSTDAPPASMQPGATEFPKLPAFPANVNPFQMDSVSGEQRAAGTMWLRDQGVADGDIDAYTRLQDRYAQQQQRDTQKAAREAEALQESETKKAASANTKQMREQGVRMTVDDQNQTIPQTREDGSVVYEPGWTGDPRFDDKSKSWVRDQRDEKGGVKPVDLWDNGDIFRDDDTGELYLNMPGGARNVVGKDDGYLRRRAIGKEISDITRKQEEDDIALDRNLLELKPLEEEHKAKKKNFDEAAERLRNLQSIGLKTPGWADRNAESLRTATEEFEKAKRDYTPLRGQFDAVEKRKRELEDQKLKGRERKLALYSERDTLEAARRRPEFAAPTMAAPDEPEDVKADREANGIGGDAYQIPDGNLEQMNFKLRMNHLDTLAEQLMSPTMQLGPDGDKAATLAELNDQRRAELKKHSGRQAAINLYREQDQALSLQLGASRGRSSGKSRRYEQNIRKLDAELAQGLLTTNEYAAAIAGMEQDLAAEGALRQKIEEARTDLKKRTFKALQSGEEFPETLITRNGDKADLHPSVVNQRAAGRSAAFGTTEADELYETLLDIQKSGKIQTIGGQPIRKLIAEVGAQKGLTVGDLLTSDEQAALRTGLSGTLASFKPTLLPALDGEETLAKPISDKTAGDAFWRAELARMDAPKRQKAVPSYLKELESKRAEILNRQPELPEGYESMAPAAKKKILETFFRKKDEDLEGFYRREEVKGGDRAEWVKQYRGQKPENTTRAFADELTSRVQAAVFSPTAGIWNVGAGLLDSMALMEARGLGIAPEEASLHKLAIAAREGTQDLMGEKADSLLAQVGQGAGSSLAFAPAAMTTGGLGVAALGAASGFGPGYYEAREKAAAKGKEMPDWKAYLNGIIGMGIGATEGIPMAHALDRLDKFTGGSIRRLLDIAKQGGEEFVQEAFSTAAQGFADKIQGLDDRQWKEILGDSMKGGSVAALSGLLMGIGMNMVGERAQLSRTKKIEAAFGSLDRVYSDLSEAVRSPEALASFNATREVPLTMQKASDLLKQTEKARNAAATQVLLNDEKLVAATIEAIAPDADKAKMAATIADRSGVLAEVAALGRDLAPIVAPKAQKTPPLLRNIVSGHVVLEKMQTLLEGGTIPPDLGKALEKQGYLVQQPTQTGTRWVLTGPALSLMDGETRRAVAKAPQKFAYEPAADTAKPGTLTRENKVEGDRQLSQTLNPPRQQQAAPPAAAPAKEAASAAPAVGGSYTVTLESEPDSAGFTTRKKVTVQAASPEAAGPAALEQAKSWKGQWTPLEIIPDQSAAPTYPSDNGTGAPTTSPADTGGEVSTLPAVETNTSGQGVSEKVSQGVSQEEGQGDGGVSVEPSSRSESADRAPETAGDNAGNQGNQLLGVWSARESDPGLLRRVLTRARVRFSERSGQGTVAIPAKDGTIAVNFDPSQDKGNAEYRAASADEELRHVAALIAKRAEWQASGENPTDFTAWLAEDGKAIFNDLAERLSTLEGAERAAVENAIVGSFNLYWADYRDDGRVALTIGDIRRLVDSGRIFKSQDKAATYFDVVHEFARQMVQLREVGAITENTFDAFLKRVIQWMRDATAALRSLALDIDAEGGMLDGTRIQELIREMEAETRRLHQGLNNAGMESQKEDLDKGAMSPVMSWLEEQGGVIGKGKAVNPGGEYDDAIPIIKLGGHAAKIYGTALTPDEAAQGLFDAGLIAEASATAMWEALESEVRTLRELRVRPNHNFDSEPGSSLAARPLSAIERSDWLLDEANSITVQSGLVGDPRVEGFRKALQAVYKGHGSTVNQWDGKKILFPMSSWKKMRNHLADRNLQAIIPSLPRLMAEAMPLYTAPDVENKDLIWRTYGVPARINGVQSLVKLVGFEQQEGKIILDFFHDASVTDWADTKKRMETTFQISNPAHLPPSKDKLLNWLVEVNHPNKGTSLGARPPSIETNGEGNLFGESDLPFNLVGEVDDTALRQARIDAQAALEASKKAAEDAQGSLFTRRPQAWFNFGVDGSQLGKDQLPLTLADALTGATPDAKRLFNENLGLAHKIANDYRNLGEYEDVRQEALMALARAAASPRFDPAKAKFSTYAGTIIRNHLNDLYGKAIRTVQTESLEAELGESGRTLEDVTPDRAESPAVSAQRAEALATLENVINSLPEDLREVIQRRMTGATQEEVGSAMGGKPKQTISNMEKVAMAMIRTRLKARGVEGIPLAARPAPGFQSSFDREFDAQIFPQPSDAPTPGGRGSQETFTSTLDRQLFPSMVDQDESIEPHRGISDDEADALAGELIRDAHEIADVIAQRPEAPEHKPGVASTLRDHYNRHLRGRFDKMNYFSPGAGEVLQDNIRDNAHFAAAMRQFTAALDEKVKAAFGHPSYWRNKAQRDRLNRFKAEILPYAAALNPIARDGARDFVFEDFWQRAGELSGAQIERMNRLPGEEWVDGKTGERWRIGDYVVPDPKKPDEGFYQQERYIPAAAQQRLHADFHSKYAEAAGLLDDFIEPNMEDERVISPQGIELPSFNRHSLYGFYGDTPAGLVNKLPGYTPDVLRTRSLAGVAAKVLNLKWQSPGRDYKSGQARISGQVRDLFEGFNIRAAQAHMETARRDAAEQLLKATIRPVPETGLPPDYVRLDRDTLNPLIRALRSASKKDQSEMPEIMAEATERLTQKNIETIRFLFGDPALFDPNQMIQREVLAEIERGFTRLRLDNEFLDGLMSWLRGNVAGVLADFQTIAINKLSNYIFHALRIAQRTAYAGIATTMGEKDEAKVAFREAGYLVRGFFTNFYHPAIRDRINRIVPPELFEDQNVLRQLISDDADKSVTDLLKQANVGGALLKAIGYGEMDVRAKQKLALASLLARGSIAADEVSEYTDAKGKEISRKEWVRKWAESAPLDARREAEAAAKLFLMDYANVPWWLDGGRKIEVGGHDITPIVNFVRTMTIPFWKYPYNYLRQMKRLTFDSAATLMPGKIKLPGGKQIAWAQNTTKKERIEALANLTGLAMMMSAYWLLTHPWGDDDEILGREVDDAGEDLDPKLRTSSRVRLAKSSVLGAVLGTATRMFGADNENDELWVRMRTMPYATQAMAMGAALNWITEPTSGDAKTAVSSVWDMLEDFMSVGSGAQLGMILMGYRDDYTGNQTTPFLISQRAVDLLTGRVLPPRLLKDITTLIDPINRRYTPAESIGYEPGAFEGLLSRLPGATKFLPPSGKVTANADPNSEKTRAALAELQAMGLADSAYREYIDDKTGKLRAAYVRPDYIYTIPGWKAAVRQLGFNVKPVPRSQYADAVAGVDAPQQ